MIFEWSICQCCGHSATQRMIETKMYGKLYPDLCDQCVLDLGRIQGTPDEVYAEIKTREEYFKKTFTIIGFHPFIRRA